MRGMRGQGALTALRRVDGETGTARAYLQGATEVTLAGVAVVVDCDGALYWPDEGVLAIADLHLEKGSSFAARGVPLPPYDTAATLARLVLRVGRCVPRTVIAQRQLSRPRWACPHGAAADRAALVALQRGRDWIWIAGNHDPDPAIGIGGSFAPMLAIGAFIFRHQPSGGEGEIAGHRHPVATVRGRGRNVTRRCFASDGTRLVMPAFGASADGLNVRDRAFADVFGMLGFTVYMLGEGRTYVLAAKACLAD